MQYVHPMVANISEIVEQVFSAILRSNLKAGCDCMIDNAGCSKIQKRPRAVHRTRAKMVLVTIRFAKAIRCFLSSPNGQLAVRPEEALLIQV